VLNKATHQQITAWIALRDDAAHSNYTAYDENMVRLFVEGLRHFVLTHPA
jgi:hypothetical protein